VYVFATVKATEPFIDGILALRFDPAKLDWVSPDSLYIFRWDAKGSRFVK
jgi:hypothetical protein